MYVCIYIYIYTCIDCIYMSLLISYAYMSTRAARAASGPAEELQDLGARRLPALQARAALAAGARRTHTCVCIYIYMQHYIYIYT